MRIRVKDVLDLLAAGVSEAEMLVDFPYLETEDILGCPAFSTGSVSIKAVGTTVRHPRESGGPGQATEIPGFPLARE